MVVVGVVVVVVVVVVMVVAMVKHVPRVYSYTTFGCSIACALTFSPSEPQCNRLSIEA